jgi:hypothetical protein
MRGPGLGTKLELVDAQKGTMLDIFARCLKKEIAQVCTLFKQRASFKEELTANTILVVMYRSIDSLRKHSGYIAMQQSVTRQQITS